MLRAKLAWPQAVLALALACVGGVALWSLHALGTSSERILQDNYRSVLAAQRMKESLERLDSAALIRLAGRDEAAARTVAGHWEVFERELQVQERNVTEAGEGQATARLRAAWERYRAAWEPFEREAGRETRTRSYFDDLDPVFHEVKGAAEAVLALNQDAMVRKSEEAQRLATRLVAATLAATLGGLLLGLLLSSGLTARITRPLSVLTQTARRLAHGDLAARATVAGEDELAELAREFNAMADQLARYRASSLGDLLRAQQAAQAAIDALPDPVMVVDPAGALLSVNSAATALLGLSPEGEGAGLAGLDPALRAALDRARGHVLTGKGAFQPRGFEDAVRLEGAEGPRFLLPRATPLYGESGGVDAAAVVLQDVTRLLRFDELKNDLVATVAHEIRTPLTSLRMAIHLCAEEVAGPLSERQADLIHAARGDCERLQGIVDDLLDLSRIQSGAVELVRRPAPVRHLVEEAARAVRGAAAEAGIHLEVEAPEPEAEALVDQERLGLVLVNLLSNAVRHTPAGGRVTITAAQDGAGWRFQVSDTGVGIAPEYHERIFEKYFRVPGQPRGGSVGLGLFLAREIVRAHGGVIEVESAPGAGSRFTFTVPAAPAAEAPAPSQRP